MIVGYSFDADTYCVGCTFDYARNVPVDKYVFGSHQFQEDYQDVHGHLDLEELIQDEIIRDGEGNPIHPMWSIFEAGDAPDHCAQCGKYLDTSWTAETMEYVRQALVHHIEEWLQDREGGNPEVLDVWAEQLHLCIGLESADEKALDLYEHIRKEE